MRWRDAAFRWRWLLVGLAVWLAGCAAVPVWGASNRLVGDEPHYLLTTESLVSDADLDLADEYAQRAYGPYHHTDLIPQDAPRMDGARLAPHGVGLSILMVPGYAAGGWAGARVELALVAALVLVGAGILAERFVPSPRWAAPAAAVALGLTAPLWVYATQVYPEVPAAGVLVGACLLVTGKMRRRRPLATATALALAIGALMLLGIKYLPLAACLGFVAVVRLRHSRRGIVLVSALSVVLVGAVFAWTAHTFGGPTTYATNRVYQGSTEAAMVRDNIGGLARSPRLVALLFDRNFGIVRFAPLWMLAVAASGAMAARRRDLWPLAALVGVQWATAVWLALTMRGWWFPGRQVVTVLPLFAPALAWLFARLPRLTAVFTAVSLFWCAALVRALDAHLAGAGRDPFLAPIPGFGVAGRLFPTFHDPVAGDWIRVAAWTAMTVALGVWFWRRGRASPPTGPAPTGPAGVAAAAPGALVGGIVVGLPARDEAATVADVVRRAAAVPGVLEVVVVDDASVDGTAARARAAGATVLEPAPGRSGLGAAVARILAHGAEVDGAAAVAFLDADGEYAPEDLAALAVPVLDGSADYVSGNRFATPRPAGMPLWRRLGNRAGSLVVSALVGRRVRDAQSGIRVLSRRAAAAARVRHDYNYAQVLTIDLWRRGFPLHEIAATYDRRRNGRSFVRLPTYLRRVVPAMLAARWGRPERAGRPDRPDHTAASAATIGGEAARFALTGVAASGVDLLLFWTLTTAGVALLVANPVSMAVRLGLAFWLTRTWVFGEREVRSPAQEAVLFLAVAALNVAVQEAILWGAVVLTSGGLTPWAATAVKATATAVTFAGRFVLSRRYVFRATT